MVLPNRFDVIYASKIFEKETGQYIGYVINTEPGPQKSLTIGSIPYSSTIYHIKFINNVTKIYSDSIIKEYIDKCLWKIETPTTLKQEKAKYEIGDLVYNKISEKVSLINNVLDGEDKDTVLDIQTKQHSRFWYKIQAPGQVQEPLSETIIDYGIENKWFEIHKKK